MAERLDAAKMWRGSEMENVIRDLKRNFEFNSGFRDYVIHGEIRPEHLQALVELPEEVGITEQNGKLILSKGTTSTPYGYGSDDRESVQRHANSKVSFHTHQKLGKDADYIVSPTFEDIYMDEQRTLNHLPPSLIASPAGLVLYRAPVEKGNVLKQINKFRGDYLNIGKLFDGEYMLRMARKFALETNSILAETDWNDGEKVVELMRRANLDLHQ